mmetsp:Transcript_28408/g.51777  ORF Transcript_28408/g.51777 Transcript_28408/m.51777 type:complete len:136 (+) Transcript_28408:754-1161(+)
MGIDRSYQTQILAHDCKTPITPENLLRLTTERNPNNDRSETLTLNYSVEKSLLTSSNVWNEAMNQLNMCQVVQLVLPDEAFVITEDRRVIDINIDFSAHYSIGDVGLSPGEAENSTDGEDPVEGGTADGETLQRN